MTDILHLAIPSTDIDESIDFYIRLGSSLGRKSSSWAILNFFNMQLVLHKNQSIELNPSMYPRHFGVIVSYDDFDYYYDLAKTNDLKFYQESFTRFLGEISEHKTFFLCDPSNNLIEIKCYRNIESIFGK